VEALVADLRERCSGEVTPVAFDGRAPALPEQGLIVATAAGGEAALIERLAAVGRSAELSGEVDGTGVALLEASGTPALEPAPSGFRVLAVISAYNEADIIEPSVRALWREGAEVHVIDNWSTDGTHERMLELRRQGPLVVTRWPAAGPDDVYDAFANMREKERVMLASGADWVLQTDVDELREGPWPGVGLRDALHHVEARGANAVDHTCVIFPPVDDSYVPGSDFGAHFRHFEFGRRRGHFFQVKAFKPLDGLELASTAGHDARFPGRRVFPYKFLLRHYPIRSQEHGRRKVLVDRVPRFSEDDVRRGWHTQYEGVSAETSFLRDPRELEVFDDFHSRFLPERLTGAGLRPPG
jgi:hypothetical protein